jgi:hypothetical protein
MPRKMPWFAWLSKLLPDALRGPLALRIVTCLLVVLPFTSSAQAQVVVPGLRFGSSIAGFGTFTGIKPNYQYFTDNAVYGFTIGGYLQTRSIIGVEIRGSVAKWGSVQHEEAALAGPRAALHLGRFSPYVGILGGGGHVWIAQNHPLPGHERISTAALGPQWTVLGGIDVHFLHKWSIRAGELTYSRVYTDHETVRPLGASAGIVYRFR